MSSDSLKIFPEFLWKIERLALDFVNQTTHEQNTNEVILGAKSAVLSASCRNYSSVCSPFHFIVCESMQMSGTN